VKNPWNIDNTPGGSSGGSIAAVAAGMCPVSLGSDTAGSVRQPAAFCGVTGLKPTYGRISRYGLIAFASSMDQIGPAARTAEDIAYMLKVMAGHDKYDSTSSSEDVDDYTGKLNSSIEGKVIGVPKEYFAQGLDDSIRTAVENVLDFYKNRGCVIKEISLPHTEFAIACYYILAPAEASSNLARYDGIRYGYRVDEALPMRELYSVTRQDGFGDEVKRRIMLGTYVLSSGYYDAYYKKAQKVRTLIREDFVKKFNDVDFIITPTTPTTAFKIGEKLDDPLAMYLSDIYTATANLAGIPAVSVPCGFDNNNLPIGFQILGKWFDESGILNLAHVFQLATDHHKRTPELLKG
jgi:aspartyl-tRNA(Asn)/glutamyl-tRNA(Gln) amidotransferase subunit A